MNPVPSKTNILFLQKDLSLIKIKNESLGTQPPSTSDMNCEYLGYVVTSQKMSQPTSSASYRVKEGKCIKVHRKDLKPISSNSLDTTTNYSIEPSAARTSSVVTDDDIVYVCTVDPPPRPCVPLQTQKSNKIKLATKKTVISPPKRRIVMKPAAPTIPDRPKAVRQPRQKNRASTKVLLENLWKKNASVVEKRSEPIRQYGKKSARSILKINNDNNTPAAKGNSSLGDGSFLLNNIEEVMEQVDRQCGDYLEKHLVGSVGQEAYLKALNSSDPLSVLKKDSKQDNSANEFAQSTNHTSMNLKRLTSGKIQSKDQVKANPKINILGNVMLRPPFSQRSAQDDSNRFFQEEKDELLELELGPMNDRSGFVDKKSTTSLSRTEMSSSSSNYSLEIVDHSVEKFFSQTIEDKTSARVQNNKNGSSTHRSCTPSTTSSGQGHKRALDISDFPFTPSFERFLSDVQAVLPTSFDNDELVMGLLDKPCAPKSEVQRCPTTAQEEKQPSTNEVNPDVSQLICKQIPIILNQPTVVESIREDFNIQEIVYLRHLSPGGNTEELENEDYNIGGRKTVEMATDTIAETHDYSDKEPKKDSSFLEVDSVLKLDEYYANFGRALEKDLSDQKSVIDKENTMNSPNIKTCEGEVADLVGSVPKNISEDTEKADNKTSIAVNKIELSEYSDKQDVIFDGSDNVPTEKQKETVLGVDTVLELNQDTHEKLFGEEDTTDKNNLAADIITSEGEVIDLTDDTSENISADTAEADKGIIIEILEDSKNDNQGVLDGSDNKDSEVVEPIGKSIPNVIEEISVEIPENIMEQFGIPAKTNIESKDLENVEKYSPIVITVTEAQVHRESCEYDFVITSDHSENNVEIEHHNPNELIMENQDANELYEKMVDPEPQRTYVNKKKKQSLTKSLEMQNVSQEQLDLQSGTRSTQDYSIEQDLVTTETSIGQEEDDEHLIIGKTSKSDPALEEPFVGFNPGERSRTMLMHKRILKILDNEKFQSGESSEKDQEKTKGRSRESIIFSEILDVINASQSETRNDLFNRTTCRRDSFLKALPKIQKMSSSRPYRPRRKSSRKRRTSFINALPKIQTVIPYKRQDAKSDNLLKKAVVTPRRNTTHDLKAKSVFFNVDIHQSKTDNFRSKIDSGTPKKTYFFNVDVEESKTKMDRSKINSCSKKTSTRRNMSRPENDPACLEQKSEQKLLQSVHSKNTRKNRATQMKNKDIAVTQPAKNIQETQDNKKNAKILLTGTSRRKPVGVRRPYILRYRTIEVSPSPEKPPDSATPTSSKIGVLRKRGIKRVLDDENSPAKHKKNNPDPDYAFSDKSVGSDDE